MAARRLRRIALPPRMQQKLETRRMATAKDVFDRSEMDLVNTLEASAEEVHALLTAVSAAVAPQPRTAMDMLHAQGRGRLVSCA
jgi:hypothetical protein